MANGKDRRLFPAGRVIALAALAGAIAGAAAVYVSDGMPGNNAPAGQAVVEAGDGSACAAKAERAKAVADAAKGQVAALLPADPPISLAALAFQSPDGKPMRLADRGGKALLVNLWATWCAPCRAEMPALDRLQAAEGGDDFEVMAINVDTGDDVKPRKFLEEIGVKSLGFYRDASMEVFNDLKRKGLALGLPVTALVDAQGCLIAHMNGPAEWDSPDALAVVKALETVGP